MVSLEVCIWSDEAYPVYGMSNAKYASSYSTVVTVTFDEWVTAQIVDNLYDEQQRWLSKWYDEAPND